MEAWWQGLSLLNKAFFLMAMGFSTLFLWQVISMFLGMGGDSHCLDQMDAHSGADFHHGDAQTDHPHSGDGGGVTFSLVSIRSVLAFGTLFSWAGTLYLATGTSAPMAVLFSAMWGLAAMVGVSYLVYCLLGMQETGTASLWSAVGEKGVVYMNVPENGMGKIRVMVKGVICFVNARTTTNEALPAGTPVRVVGVTGDNALQIERTNSPAGE
ncbi:MAG: hypothetical protein AB1646_03560 [Thermodesulfobacteriota bacterium]